MMATESAVGYFNKTKKEILIWYRTRVWKRRQGRPRLRWAGVFNSWCKYSGQEEQKTENN
jgi:hypothetical protein